jgi:hypothetical protein
MAAAGDLARNLGAQALWLDAYDSEAGVGPFYMKCGFREAGRMQHRGVALICYEWPLGGTGTP